MTVYDLIWLFTEDYFTVELYDLNKGELFTKGNAQDIAQTYGHLEVMSIDVPFKPYTNKNCLTINIER